MKENQIFFGFYLTEADPWYSNRFDVTYRDVVRGCEAFLQELISKEKVKKKSQT